MNVPNRAALISKTYKVLKKHYRPEQPQSNRSVLDHVLYACCLENSLHQDADDVFAKLLESYFDWNEIRVTTTRELASAMSGLRDSSDAAKRLKSTLQSVFEAHYSFDLDFFRKQNLGKAVKEFERLKGTTPFCIGYLTQNALSGHSIPVNDGALQALYVVGIVTEAEAKKRRTPGLERAIPKSKGVEFASLLHQLGADFKKSPFSTNIRAILMEIAPDGKDRLPKRGKKPQPVVKKSSTTAKKAPAKASAAHKKKKDVKKVAAPSKKKASASKALKKKPR
jgi:endonuclease-3